MSPVLKLSEHDEKKEILFELKYQLSLTTRQRFEMMFKRTEELRKLMGKSGSRKTVQIIKRTGSYESEKLDDLKKLRRKNYRSI
jgi:hypothetical protein